MNVITTRLARFSDTTQHLATLVAGWGIVAMTLLTVGADILIFQQLIVPEDATATANNIIDNEALFRMGIGSYLVVIILDVVVAWALYIFFSPTSQNLSLLAAWFRLLYSAIFAVALINYFDVFQWIENADYLTVFEPTEANAQVMLSINAFADGWDIGFIFLGLHLICLGNLVLRSTYVPWILGILVGLAGVGYLISKLTHFLLPDYDLSMLMMIGWGELIFAVWLLWKGNKGTKRMSEINSK